LVQKADGSYSPLTDDDRAKAEVAVRVGLADFGAYVIRCDDAAKLDAVAKKLDAERLRRN
jgi:hypothetical protein